MKFNRLGMAYIGCKVGNHTNIIIKPCTHSSCPYPTHKFCILCNKFIGYKIDGVTID
jgi:hypothetical protein